MFRVIPVETMTGRRILPWIDTGDFSWKSSLTTPGDGSFPLMLRDHSRWGDRSPAEISRVAAQLSRGWGTTYVVETSPDSPRPGQIVYAGLVVDSSWDADAGILTVKTKEVAELLKRRPVFTFEEMSWVLQRTFTGPNMGDIVRDIIYGAFKRPALGEDSLPVDVPTGAGSGALSKQVFRYNFPTAQQVLDDVAAEGGPDWFLRPAWSGTQLRWGLEVGSPDLTSGEIRLPVASPRVLVASPVVGLSMAESFQDQWTHIAAIGAGSEVDMRWAQHSRTPPAGVPGMFTTESHKHLDAQSELAGVASQATERSSGGVRQLSYGLQLSQGGRVSPDMVRVGSRLLLDHAGDEMLPAGRSTEYVLEVSGGNALDLQVESQGVSGGY